MTLFTARDKNISVQRPRRETTTVDTIIIHAMSEYLHHEGKVVCAMDFLNDIQLGCHYFIAPDGLVLNGVAPEFRTPHVGKSEYLDRKWLNETSIGIEFLVPGINTYDNFLIKLDSRDTFTDEQYKSGGELIARLNKNFPSTIARAVGHMSVSGDDVRGEGRGKKDPGEYFNWGALDSFTEEAAFVEENKPKTVADGMLP